MQVSRLLTFMTAVSVTVLGIVYAVMGRGPTAAALLTLAAGYGVIAFCYRG